MHMSVMLVLLVSLSTLVGNGQQDQPIGDGEDTHASTMTTTVGSMNESIQQHPTTTTSNPPDSEEGGMSLPLTVGICAGFTIVISSFVAAAFIHSRCTATGPAPVIARARTTTPTIVTVVGVVVDEFGVPIITTFAEASGVVTPEVTPNTPTVTSPYGHGSYYYLPTSPLLQVSTTRGSEPFAVEGDQEVDTSTHHHSPDFHCNQIEGDKEDDTTTDAATARNREGQQSENGSHHPNPQTGDDNAFITLHGGAITTTSVYND